MKTLYRNKFNTPQRNIALRFTRASMWITIATTRTRSKLLPELSGMQNRIMGPVDEISF